MTAVAGDPFNVEGRISSARSLLFVPGDRPDRITTALRSVADGVIVDLEDAVRPESRAQARVVLRRIADLAPGTAQSLLLVRVNAFGSPDFTEDVEAAMDGGAAGIVLPKFVPGKAATEMDEALTALETGLGRSSRLPVIGLVESATGLLGLFVPPALPARLIRLAFGAADLHADLGITYRAAGIHTDLAMATIALASAAAGLAAPLDSPYFALADDAGLADSVRSAREAGFGGKLCIHPKQLEAVHAGFSISDAERRWAEQVLAQWSDPASRGAGAIRVHDQLVDEAMVRRARKIMNSESWTRHLSAHHDL